MEIKEKNLLSASERLRLMFLREFGGRAQEAMDYVINNKGDLKLTKKAPVRQVVISGDGGEADGVYFVKSDCSTEKFTGQKSVANVDYIGLILGHIRFGVQLKDKGNYPLIESRYNACEEHSSYYTSQNNRSCHEGENFIAATANLMARGCKIPLETGEFLPLVKQWDVMGMYRSQLQEALIAAGGEPIADDTWYWSASEHSRNYAWPVYFSDGNTDTYDKCTSYRVRAVVAF